MATNSQRLQCLCIEDDVDTVMNIAGDEVCEVCDREITKNLNPQNPACEGRWCEEAVELWLGEEVKESNV